MQNVVLALHSLGWKAFRDLCGTVLKEILGQTVLHFFDSRDGGRDGAFSEVWRQKAKWRIPRPIHCALPVFLAVAIGIFTGAGMPR